MRVGLHRIGRESELLVVTDEVSHAGKGAERVVVEVRLLLVEAERGAEVAGAGVHEEGVTGAHVHLVHHVVVMVVSGGGPSSSSRPCGGPWRAAVGGSAAA